jgi:hypothetical protein
VGGGGSQLRIQQKHTVSLKLYCTLKKKENKIFLIFKGIQNGVVAKSYTTNGLLLRPDI